MKFYRVAARGVLLGLAPLAFGICYTDLVDPPPPNRILPVERFDDGALTGDAFKRAAKEHAAAVLETDKHLHQEFVQYKASTIPAETAALAARVNAKLMDHLKLLSECTLLPLGDAERKAVQSRLDYWRGEISNAKMIGSFRAIPALHAAALPAKMPEPDVLYSALAQMHSATRPTSEPAQSLYASMLAGIRHPDPAETATQLSATFTKLEKISEMSAAQLARTGLKRSEWESLTEAYQVAHARLLQLLDVTAHAKGTERHTVDQLMTTYHGLLKNNDPMDLGEPHFSDP